MLRDIKGVIRSPKSKDKNTMTKRKRTEEQAMILHRKLMIEQHEPHFITRVNSGATKEEAVLTPLVTLVM